MKKLSTKLHFGCGSKILKDYTNIDVTTAHGAEVACDMNIFPYPFPNNYADHILCVMTLEHIKHPTKAIEEFHRIVKEKGTIKIIVPHFSSLNSLMADQHINVFSCWYFQLFDISTTSQNGEEYWYVTLRKFKNIDIFIKFPMGFLTPISFPFQLLFSKHRIMQKFYEHFLSNIYRANELHVIFKNKIS